MMHAFEVDSVILEFDTKRILQDVYLKCTTGTITGLLGRNGSGKTCLLNIIYGEINIPDKSLRLDGEAVYGASRKREDFMYLPQFQFVPVNLKIKRIFSDFELDFCRFVGYFPEFEKYHHSKFRQLSGGERRIIEIYLILASKTKICMLDEPFSQVMPRHVETLKKLLLTEKENKGIIVTDHLYKDIIDVCDDLYVLNSGKTWATKDISDLKKLGYIN